MNLKTYNIANIKKHSKRRPKGYMDDLKSIAKINGDEWTFDIDSKEWKDFKNKYSTKPTKKTTSRKGGCGGCSRKKKRQNST